MGERHRGRWGSFANAYGRPSLPRCPQFLRLRNITSQASHWPLLQVASCVNDHPPHYDCRLHRRPHLKCSEMVCLCYQAFSLCDVSDSVNVGWKSVRAGLEGQRRRDHEKDACHHCYHTHKSMNTYHTQMVSC